MRTEILITAIIIMASACQNKMPSEYMTVDQDSLELPNEANVSTLVFTTNTPWKATINAPWCKVYPNSGNGRFETEITLKLSYDENTWYQDREVELCIEYGKQKKIIPIKQSHCSLYVDDKIIQATQEESTITLDYWAEGNIQIEIDPECSKWISTIANTKSMDRHSLQVRIKKNTSTGRTGKIYLCGDKKTETIEIQQHAANIKFLNDETRQRLTEFRRDYDLDRDGEISLDEAAAIKEIDAHIYLTVKELSYFTSLVKCQCILFGKDYHIKDNRNLKVLSVYMDSEDIKDLKISESVPISTLNINSSTNLKSIDLRGSKLLNNVNLSNLSISYGKNMDISINLDNCSNLQNVNISYSPKIKELSLQGTTNLLSLNVSSIAINSLSLNDCTSLKTLNCNYCENISELDVSNNKQLKEISFYTNNIEKKKKLYLSKDNTYSLCLYNEENTTVFYR